MVVFTASLFVWGVIQPLLGKEIDRAFLLLSGALLLNTAANLPTARPLRYAFAGMSMVLVASYFLQR